ncbi:MAG: lysylphosphatidylglycerol synthase domain-containing protein, partial [Myxococcota bacterium]
RRTLAPLRRVSQRLAEAAERALAAVAVLGGRRAALLQAFGLSVLAQALPVAAVAALARPLDSDVAWFWYAAIVPFITLLTLIPISIGGAGVREYLFVRLFEPLGMRPEVALSLSLSVFAVTLAWGVVGIALFAWGRRRGSLSGAAAS